MELFSLRKRNVDEASGAGVSRLDYTSELLTGGGELMPNLKEGLTQ
jgi:hypothetical protein